MRHLIALTVPILTLAACVSDAPKGPENPHPSHSVWLEPGVQLQSELDRRAADLPYVKTPLEQQQVIEWFVNQGELGYATLLEAAGGPSDEAAVLALTALVSSRDRRLVPHLQAIPFPEASHKARQLAHARALMLLGDWTKADVLIAGLRSESVFDRALSAAALQRSTHTSFGFKPDGEVEAREAAAQKWEAWNEARRTDPLLR